jgi:hypothetical protein
MRTAPIVTHIAGAGLFAGAAAWTLHQQGGYSIASWVCGGAAGPVWSVTILALVLVLGGGWFSWRALRLLAADGGAFAGARQRPRHFLALIGVMAAFLFLFAIFLQAGAVLFLPGCTG